MSISGSKDRVPDRGAKMTGDTVVLDVSRDWATASDVQETVYGPCRSNSRHTELQRTLPAAARLGLGFLRFYASAS
jgi:hypothetical protein